jgi:hypothetical protein
VGIFIDASIADGRDSGTGRVSLQQTSSLISKISHECAFFFIGVSSEGVLSIGDTTGSSSTTEESSVVVIGLRREGKVFGHLPLLNEPQSSTD